MNRSRAGRPAWIIVALGAALLLGGCGRKAGLDLPPSAGVQPTAVEEEGGGPPRSGVPSAFEAARTEGGPSAARGRKRGFVLDPLLD